MGKINIKEKNKGKFSAWAKAHGMSVQQAARHVLANRKKYSPTLIKRANFARNAAKWEEGGVYDEYGLGGFLQSIAPIAGLIPGVGGAISAGLSGIGGVIDGKNQQNEQIKQLGNKSRQSAAISQANVLNPYTPTFKVGGTFKGKRFGGKPNAEVEGGEVLITPDGIATNVYGNSHAQGGVDVNLPNNTMILSDKIKVGKGQTAADVARPYVNKINKAKETMAGNATKLSKNSSQLNLNKYYSKVFDTFNKQEAKKNKYQGGGWHAPLKLDYVGENDPIANLMYPFPKGTEQYPYSIAGEANVIGTRNTATPTVKPTISSAPTRSAGFTEPDLGGFDPTAFQSAGYNPSDFGDPMGAVNPMLGSLTNDGGTGMTFSNPLDLTDPVASKAQTRAGSVFGKKDKLLGALGTLGELAPTLYNLGQGLFGKREEIDPNKYNNPYEGQINSLMANRRYNIDPELIGNENAFRTTAANMRNLGGSRGQVMSNLTGAQNVKQFGDMSAYAQKKNMENQYAGEYANMLYGLGRDKSMTAMTVDESNAMNRAASRNMTASGMTGLQQYLLTRRQMKNQASMGKLLTDAIRAYSRYTDKWIPGLNELYNNK